MEKKKSIKTEAEKVEKDINQEDNTNTGKEEEKGEEEKKKESGKSDNEGEKEPRSRVLCKKDRHLRRVEALTKEKESLAMEKAEIHDKYIRLYSEFDNYRKRLQKEKLDIIKNASVNVIKGLLPILDDMERALKYKPEDTGAEDKNSEREGMGLIYQKLKTYLSRQGLKEIESLGQMFNVDYHEAITTVEASREEDKGKIMDEIQKGYTLNDKVIRFAKVVICQ